MLPLCEGRDFPFPPDPATSPAQACLTWTTHMGG
jgi:hypothetical protein